MGSDLDRLRDILEAFDQIEKYTVRSRQVFEQEELIQVWIIYYLQVIGEAARAMSAELRNQYSDVPWSGMIALRNVLVHQYFQVDVDVAWSIVERCLPEVKGQIEAILHELGEQA